MLTEVPGGTLYRVPFVTVIRVRPSLSPISHLYFGNLIKDGKGMLLQVLCRVGGRDSAYLRSRRYGFAQPSYILSLDNILHESAPKLGRMGAW